MTLLGYFLSCEEFPPAELVRQAVRAESAGFERLWISDHFHPWNDNQGQKALNEHITGEYWPPSTARREMLEEAWA